MAEVLHTERPEDRVPDGPVELLGYVWQARRAPDHEGRARFEVYVDGKLSPAGYVEVFACPEGNGELRMLPYGDGNRPLFDVGPGGEHVDCYRAWPRVLVAIEEDMASR